VQDAIEIDVVATLRDFQTFLAEISEEEEIRTLKQSLLSKGSGVTVDDRLKVGVLVKRYCDRIKADYAEQIQTVLNEVSQDFRTHDLMDDTMVLNTAFLLGRDRQADFERRVEQIDKEFEGKLNFRWVGPLPPYSFYTLEISRPQFEQIDWARERLGLERGFVTAEDIKKAHRKSALASHPDKHRGTPNIEKKFDESAKAYRILLDYYRASRQTEQGRGCCLDREAFEENAVLVTTAR
ncbi:MAG: GvpL/GvpF family gas vesicle protein, partial [Sedimentisphaerales bacterium]